MENCEVILKQGNKQILLCTDNVPEIKINKTNGTLTSTTTNIPATSVAPTTVAPTTYWPTEQTTTQSYTQPHSSSLSNRTSSLNSSYTLMTNVLVSENITNLSTFNTTTPGYIYVSKNITNTTTPGYIYVSKNTTEFAQEEYQPLSNSEPIDHFEIILYTVIGLFVLGLLLTICIHKKEREKKKRRRSVSPDSPKRKSTSANEVLIQMEQGHRETLKKQMLPARPPRPPPPPEVAKKQADAVLNRGMTIKELTQPGGMDKLKAIRKTKMSSGKERLRQQMKKLSHLRQVQKSINVKSNLNKK